MLQEAQSEPSVWTPEMIWAAQGHELPVHKHWLDREYNRRLKDALTLASNAERHIKPEQNRIRFMMDDAKNEQELAAREYQLWYTESYLKRAARLALLRIEHLRSIVTKQDIEKEQARYSTDIVHWFKYYAWGYDPRARTPLSVVPFELLPKQVELIHWIDDLVFNKRTSGLIEKSRDEGATETLVRWGLYHWQNTPGFSMLMSTRKEDEVDSKKNQNTMFERLRFQLRLFPEWGLPKGFSTDKNMLTSMQLANPENDNTILGEAPVENMGRGGRVTVALCDEMAFWQFAGYPQYRSLSQTTDSIIIPSSVAGRLNQYAELAHDGVTRKFVMDWRDNPFKDKRWYDSLPFGYISPKMSSSTIAQEVDRNYDAAQPGKVFHPREEYTFITRSEFLGGFEGFQHKFKDENGKFRIPGDWRVVRTHDFGKSEGHDWGYMIGAQPRASYPHSDTHFIFLARYLEPTGLTIAQAVEQWRGWERDLGLRDSKDQWRTQPYSSWHSHEQKELRRVLNQEYGEWWQAWKTDYQKGIATIETWLEIIDTESPNPWRRELMGRSKIVFVAPDGEYVLAKSERLNQWFTTVSQTDEGFATFRKELSAYHYALTELGKAVRDMRPVKEFDHIVDCLRAYSLHWNDEAGSLTREEKITREIPDEILTTLQTTTDPNEKLAAAMAYEFQYEHVVGKLFPDEAEEEFY